VLAAVQKKIRDEAAGKEGGAASDAQAPYRKILLTFASKGDKCYLALGYAAAAIAGVALPAFTFMFGDIVNGFGGSDVSGVVAQAKNMLYIGCGVFFFAWWYVAFLSISADRLAQKTKVQYLRSILRQEVAWFDQNNAQELSSRLSKDTSAIQRAIGEKAGFMAFSVAQSVAGFAFAFYRGWEFSFVLLAFVPILAGLAFALSVVLGAGYSEYIKAYGQSAGYAEQALTAIRVVHSYGMEAVEQRNYAKFLDRARDIGIKQSWQLALGISSIWTAMFLFYAYAFYFGSVFILSPTIKNKDDTPYLGGDVAACLFGIIFGAFSIGGAMPNVRAFVEGQTSGYQVY
jgi:ATP-binding cassette subfamily B (MDR/TAP) protein 1